MTGEPTFARENVLPTHPVVFCERAVIENFMADIRREARAYELAHLRTELLLFRAVGQVHAASAAESRTDGSPLFAGRATRRMRFARAASS
jgi:hypothetical protein